MTFTSAYKVTAVLAALATCGAMSAPLQATAQTTPTQTPADPAQPDAAAAAQTSTQASTQTSAQASTQDSVSAQAGASAADAANPARDFIRQTFLANEFGIAAAQVAIAKAQSPQTKAAAQTVLNDGLKVRQDMIAAIQGSTSDMHFDQTWNADYKARLADLQTAADSDFDQKYATVQGQVLNAAAAAATSYATTGTDASVKTFAGKTASTFQADAGKLAATATAAKG